MIYGKKTLFAAAVLALSSAPAFASTVTETYMFDATLSSGSVMCGAYVSLEVACADKFGSYSGSQADDLMFGTSMGSTYSGMVTLSYDLSGILEASCELNGRDCGFGSDLLRAPFGPDADVDFSSPGMVLSEFSFAGDTGSYYFGTDYTDDADGSIYYYSGVQFDLTNVERTITSVPLMGSGGLLLAGLGGFAVARRSRRKN